MIRDGSGTQPNLWASSLHETLAADQQAFYAGLPEFEYRDEVCEYLRRSATEKSTKPLAITWFLEVSGDYLNLRFSSADLRQIRVIGVLTREPDFCPECTG